MFRKTNVELWEAVTKDYYDLWLDEEKKTYDLCENIEGVIVLLKHIHGRLKEYYSNEPSKIRKDDFRKILEILLSRHKNDKEKFSQEIYEAFPNLFLRNEVPSPKLFKRFLKKIL